MDIMILSIYINLFIDIGIRYRASNRSMVNGRSIRVCDRVRLNSSLKFPDYGIQM